MAMSVVLIVIFFGMGVLRHSPTSEQEVWMKWRIMLWRRILVTKRLVVPDIPLTVCIDGTHSAGVCLWARYCSVGCFSKGGRDSAILLVKSRLLSSDFCPSFFLLLL